MVNKVANWFAVLGCLCFLAGIWPRSGHAEQLTVCTFTHGPTAQMDEQVARSVFARLNLPYSIVPVKPRFDAKPLSKHKLSELLEKTCDLFMGIPVSGIDPGFVRGLSISAPYLDTSFVRFSIEPRAAGRTLAVAYGTPAQLIAAEEKDATFDVENSSAEVIAAVVAGKAASGIIWYPSLVAYRRQHRDIRFDVSATHSQVANWQIGFIADGRNSKLIGRLTAAIEALVKSGALPAITSPWTAQLAEAAQPGRSRGSVETAAPTEAGASGARSPETADVSGAGPVSQYANEQALAGAKLYVSRCAKCHGDHLQGNVGPALQGPAFAPKKGSTITIAGVYQFLETNMPADMPGKLKPNEYASIMAFLLHRNGYQPTGKILTPDQAENEQSEFDSYAP